MKFSWKRLGLISSLSLALFVAGCGSDDDATDTTDTGSNEEVTETTDTVSEDKAAGPSEEVELAYVEWETEVASTHVIGKVLEDEGYDVTVTPLDNAIMWQAVANGEADASVAAWLPLTHGEQIEEYGDDIVHLGPNLEGAKIGLVVPSYMDVDSIEDLTDQVDQTITGIDAGAGVVAAAERTLDEYENMADWEVQTSSSGAMTTALGQALNNEEDIIVTGWSPHWKFQTYDLKYLDDPNGTFGDAETIDTFTRQGLEEDLPGVYQILDNFYWETADIESVMLEISEGVDPVDAAANWVEANQDKVAEWTNGVE